MEGEGQGQVRMPQSFSTFHLFPQNFQVAFFLIQCLLGCCNPFSVFQSCDKVGSESAYFPMFLWEDENLELRTLLFSSIDDSHLNHYADGCKMVILNFCNFFYIY